MKSNLHLHLLHLSLGLILIFMPAAALAAETVLLRDLEMRAGITKQQVSRLRAEPIATSLEVDNPKRAAAFVALIRIKSNGARLPGALKTADLAKTSDAYLAFGRFGEPAIGADIADVQFPEDDIDILPDCEIAECKFKLDRPGIEALGSIDWKDAKAGQTFTKRFRTWAVAYVNRYRAEGSAALIRYADKPKPVAVADTLRSLIEQFGLVGRYAPGLAENLLGRTAENTTHFESTLTWSIQDFGYRPTFAIDQIAVGPGDAKQGVESAFAISTLYANHYLAGRIQIGAVLDGGIAFGMPGHFLLLVDRIEFDDDLNLFKRKLLGRGLQSDIEGRIEMLRFLADGH